MPWHQDQPQAWVSRRKPAIDIECVLLLRLLRAAGEENDVIVGDVCELAQRLRARIVAVGLCAVVFERTGDMNLLGRRTERTEAVRRLIVLSGNQIDFSKHARHEWPDAAIAGKTMVAHPAIDDRDASA